APASCGLETHGFCKEGTAFDFIQDRHIELDRELPLNTFSGSLGTGRIHGLWRIIEGTLQASGRTGSRQVRKRQRVVRRRQGPDRNRYHVYLRGRSLLSRGSESPAPGCPSRQVMRREDTEPILPIAGSPTVQ